MKPHTLTIGLVRPDGTDCDYRYLAVICPGVDDDCRAWIECREPGCDPFELEDNDLFGHGVEHQDVGGCYSVPLPDCYLRCLGNGLEESAEHLPPGQLDDITRYVRGKADSNARWRVEYRLKGLDEAEMRNRA